MSHVQNLPVFADCDQEFWHSLNRDPHEVAVAQQPAPGRAKAGVEIDIRLGFGEAASDVPEVIRTAIRRLIALWYENRGDTGDAEMGLPPQIRALLRPFRRARL